MSAVHELVVLPDARAVARRGASIFAEAARTSVSDRGTFVVAVSGGRTPIAMFASLADEDVPWDSVDMWQVDERVAPDGDPARNLTQLVASLPPGAAPTVHAMPVGEDDLRSAAARYATGLPATFDLLHLGLGDDGHTASLVPGDPVLDVVDRDVALTGAYRGLRRMTLTYRAIGRAERVLWLVTGEEKTHALSLLLSDDPSIPASRVRPRRSLVLADAAAAGGLVEPAPRDPEA